MSWGTYNECPGALTLEHWRGRESESENDAPELQQAVPNPLHRKQHALVSAKYYKHIRN